MKDSDHMEALRGETSRLVNRFLIGSSCEGVFTESQDPDACDERGYLPLANYDESELELNYDGDF